MHTLDPNLALLNLESFFDCSGADFSRWTLDHSKRQVRVVSFEHQPGPSHRTHVAFDGVLVEWPNLAPTTRLLPIVPALAQSDPTHDAAFHSALLLDWALSKGVPPKPNEVILGLGHDPLRLPHVRYDHPFPWEHGGPAVIELDDFRLIPVLAYSISQAEAKLHHSKGARALSDHFDTRKIALFDRSRSCSLQT